MLKFKSKTYFFLFLFLIVITFSIYLFFYENNPVSNYYNNFSNSFFKLEKLKLDGRVRSNKTKILSSLSLELNSPIFNINLEKIKKNILSVPWIKSAKISRKLPNEIHIYIEEYEPAAIWEYKNELLILDKDGFITEIGQKATSFNRICAQFIGLIKFQGNGVEFLKEFYEIKKNEAKNGINPLNPSIPFEKSYMTDLLDSMIKSGKKIKAIKIKNGWLELDSMNDNETYKKLQTCGKLSKFIDLEK